jgi:hypothetical protein
MRCTRPVSFCHLPQISLYVARYVRAKLAAAGESRAKAAREAGEVVTSVPSALGREFRDPDGLIRATSARLAGRVERCRQIRGWRAPARRLDRVKLVTILLSGGKGKSHAPSGTPDLN